MAAERPRLGMHHVTVVPTNFRPDEDVETADEPTPHDDQ
jgi:hypothetical protein